MHWLIGIQVVRAIGVMFLVRYAQGTLPGVFAIPAGIGDIITGVAAPFVAYWYYKQRPWSRGIAIAWNIFGIADLINALALGILSSPAYSVIVTDPPMQILFPLVLIPIGCGSACTVTALIYSVAFAEKENFLIKAGVDPATL